MYNNNNNLYSDDFKKKNDNGKRICSNNVGTEQLYTHTHVHTLKTQLTCVVNNNDFFALTSDSSIM